MKRILLLTGIVMLSIGLSACGIKLVHDDFNIDMDQVLETLDKAYEGNREIEEDERNLVERFYNKYVKGDFETELGVYEMSDIEKELVREVYFLHMFTEHEEPLASEKTAYEKKREEIENLRNAKKVPDELKGIYPTYERQEETNETFLRDTKDIVGKLFYLTYDHSDSISEALLKELNEYVEKYGGDGFEVEGTHYLHTKETKSISLDLWSISYDLDKGKLGYYNKERLIELEEEFN